MLSILAFITGAALMSSTPLVYTALGGLISEKSGVVNIGLEGFMVIGAFSAAAVAYFSANPWLAFLLAGASGMFVATFHAFASVKFRANQVVSGLAINIFTPAFAFMLTRFFFQGAESTPALPLESKMPLWFNQLFSSGSFLANIFVQRAVVYLAFISVLLVYVFVYKTRWGLYVRSAGQCPAALHSLGINVNRVRFWSVMASGFFGGLGGASLVLNTVSIFRVGVISGQGFIALSTLIFGCWHPFGVYFTCLFFGVASALEILFGANPTLNALIPSSLLATFPYLITIAVLVFSSKRMHSPPKVAGEPFISE